MYHCISHLTFIYENDPELRHFEVCRPCHLLVRGREKVAGCVGTTKKWCPALDFIRIPSIKNLSFCRGVNPQQVIFDLGSKWKHELCIQVGDLKKKKWK